MSKIAALVPMRHHSQRVPGKNFRPLAGKPLFHHIIGSLLACPEISQVVVDTDSQPIMDGIQQHFPSVRILERPEHLRDDIVSMNEILIYDTSQVEADYYLQTHSTNPLLRPSTISRAIQSLLANIPEYDSLFSVTRLQVRLWDQLWTRDQSQPRYPAADPRFTPRLSKRTPAFISSAAILYLIAEIALVNVH